MPVAYGYGEATSSPVPPDYYPAAPAGRPAGLYAALVREQILRQVTFVLQQPLLALHAAGIAGQRALRTDHPVAGHHDADRIRTVGHADRA